MTELPPETGPTQPAGAPIPLGALIGIVVVALVGLGLLGFALINLFGAPAATPTAVAAATAVNVPATAPVMIPTVTSAPPTAAPTETTAPEPTVTAVAVATEAPAATQPPAPTQAPAPTAAPAGPVLNITLPANVRAGPGTGYGILGGLNAGSTPEVVGRDAGATWYVINYLGGRGWVSNQVAQYTGDTNALAVVAAPPLPPTAAPTATPLPAPTATAAPSAGTGGARGIRGDYFNLQTTAREFGINQDIWFEFKVTNTSGVRVPYRCLGAKIPGGPAQCSWGSSANDALGPGESIDWNDHMNIGTAGTYTLVLGICYLGDTGACQNSGTNGWEYLSSGIQVTVK